MRALGLFTLLLLGACGTVPTSNHVVLRAWAPANQSVAELPLHSNHGSAYQDYAGPALAVTAAPSIDDAGGERIPTFPSAAPPMTQMSGDEIMPNGGERPVRSEASQP